MKTIWKYPVPFPGGTINMPRGAKILALQLQNDIPTLWCAVEPDMPPEERQFVIVGTGHSYDGRMEYIGTFQPPPFVWHLFETTLKGER